MSSSPRIVSVIIGTRNRPDTLRAALASIRALESDDLKFEILVGDNGTTPETPLVVTEFGGVYDRTDVYGCPAARNVAMKRITGEFVAFLDDDDVWLPQHIRPHIAMLDANPELEAVFGQLISTDEALVPDGEPWPHSPPTDGDFFRFMMSGYFPQVGATVVRARAVVNYGLMDETLIGDSDWDWQLRIARNHKIGFVRVACALFRQRPKGSFDKLQMTRVGYTRRIFIRHASRSLSRWRTPAGVLRSYFDAVDAYCSYFESAAIERAAAGDKAAARSAVINALAIKPIRIMKALIRPTPFRRAVKDAFFTGSRLGSGTKSEISM